MADSLVAYFSATGTTAAVAKRLARVAGADTFAIEAEDPYTAADLDWRDKASRTSEEAAHPEYRPKIAGTVPDVSGYTTVYVGFPVWWYREPNIVDTFLEACDLDGRTVVPFCTSGGSKVSGSVATIAGSAPGATVLGGATLNGASDADLAALVSQAKGA